MKRQSNIKFLTELMEFSPHGGMTQMFIIDAITKHAQHVATADLSDWPSNHIISAAGWQATAQHIVTEFKSHGYITEPS